MCVGGLLQTDPQERAKTATASSGNSWLRAIPGRCRQWQTRECVRWRWSARVSMPRGARREREREREREKFMCYPHMGIRHIVWQCDLQSTGD